MKKQVLVSVLVVLAYKSVKFGLSKEQAILYRNILKVKCCMESLNHKINLHVCKQTIAILRAQYI